MLQNQAKKFEGGWLVAYERRGPSMFADRVVLEGYRSELYIILTLAPADGQDYPEVFEVLSTEYFRHNVWSRIFPGLKIRLTMRAPAEVAEADSLLEAMDVEVIR